MIVNIAIFMLGIGGLAAFGQDSGFGINYGLLKNEFFVGEPVDLYVCISNLRSLPVEVPHRDSVYSTFYISVTNTNDPPKKRISRSFCGFPHSPNDTRYVRIGSRPQGPQSELPGKISIKELYVYRIRVVYSFPCKKSIHSRNHCGLVYLSPGRYVITVRSHFFGIGNLPYPICYIGDGALRVSFNIKYPEKGTAEATVWGEIKNPKLLAFIQTNGRIGSPQVAMRVARILRNTPVSKYHNGLQSALRNYYNYQYQRLNADQRDLIRLALSMKFPPDILSAHHKRLLDSIRIHAPELYQEINVKLEVNEK